MFSSQISVYILALNIEHNHRFNLTKAPVDWAGRCSGVIHLPSTSTVVAKCDIVTQENSRPSIWKDKPVKHS